jgi:hypothetical protein
MIEVFETPLSSNIESLAYDPDLLELTVVFVSGAIYGHSGVPAHIWEALKNSVSVGKAYRSLVAKQYVMSRVE